MEQTTESMSIEQAADVLKVGVPTVEELIAGGRLAAEGEGAERRVSREALMAFLRDDQRRLMDEGDPEEEETTTAEDDLL